MDGQRFDEIAVALGGHRRTVLRALVASVGAALVGLDRAEAGPSTCKAPGQVCRRTADCCDTACRKKKGARRGRCKECADGAPYCDGGACCAAGGGTRCLNGGCFAAGSCGTVCDIGTTCGDGTSSCYCGATVAGEPVCYANEDFCSAPVPCDDDGDCPAGRVCVDLSCIGCSPSVPAACLAPCPASP